MLVAVAVSFLELLLRGSRLVWVLFFSFLTLEGFDLDADFDFLPTSSHNDDDDDLVESSSFSLIEVFVVEWSLFFFLILDFVTAFLFWVLVLRLDLVLSSALLCFAFSLADLLLFLLGGDKGGLLLLVL